MQSPSPHTPDVAPAADAIIEEVKAAAAAPATAEAAASDVLFGEIFASDDEPLYQRSQRWDCSGGIFLGPKWMMKVGPWLYREVPESDVPQCYIDDAAAHEVRLEKKRKREKEINETGSAPQSPKRQRTHNGPQPGTDASPPGIATVGLTSPADQAQQYRTSEHPTRIPIEKFGFHPLNRGGQGMIPHHAHQLASSIVTVGTSIRRYQFVRAVRVPAKEREEWLTANRNKYDQEPLCPRPTDEMCFALLTRTHFTSAQKLLKEGNRSLYNENAKPIKLRKDDVEGHKIQQDGVLCVLYSEALWDNTAALQALMAEDNDDGSVVLANDVSAMRRMVAEMQIVDATTRAIGSQPCKTANRCPPENVKKKQKLASDPGEPSSAASVEGQWSPPTEAEWAQWFASGDAEHVEYD